MKQEMNVLGVDIAAKGLNDLEPTLARYGYNARAVADLLHVRSLSLHHQRQTFARGSLRGLLPASGLLLDPRRPHCSPSGLLAACTAVRLVHWRG
jgi:hypothetical protein